MREGEAARRGGEEGGGEEKGGDEGRWGVRRGLCRRGGDEKGGDEGAVANGIAVETRRSAVTLKPVARARLRP